MSSHVARAIARYSASALDLATTSCFLLFQDIRLPPIKTQYPEVERLSVGEPAQSACVTNNPSMTSVLVQHTLAWCAFDISKNADYSIPMAITW